MFPNVGQVDHLRWLHHFHNLLLLNNWLGDNFTFGTVSETDRRRGRWRFPHFNLNVKLQNQPIKSTGIKVTGDI